MDLPFGSIYEQLEKVARDFSEKPALLYLGKEYTYSQLKEAAEVLAASLHGLGLGKGEKAILYLPSTLSG